MQVKPTYLKCVRASGDSGPSFGARSNHFVVRSSAISA